MMTSLIAVASKRSENDFARFFLLRCTTLVAFLFAGCGNGTKTYDNIREIIENDDIVVFVEEVRSGFPPLSPFPKSIDPSNGNSLHVAAEAEAKEILIWLAGRGYDFNCVDRYGMTPLMRLLSGNTSADEVLFRELVGITDLEQKDRNGFSIYLHVLAVGKPVHFDILIEKTEISLDASEELARKIDENRVTLFDLSTGNPETAAHVEGWLKKRNSMNREGSDSVETNQ